MQAPSILIVEDEAIVAEEIRRMCLKRGYEVAACVASAEEALDISRERKPDLVLMDIVLNEDKDGIMTAMTIREKWGLPFILMTAYSGEDMLARVKASGSYGYLFKPIRAIELEVAIESALTRVEIEKRLLESERRFSRLAENSPAIIYQYHVKPHGKFEYLSPAVVLLTGYTAEEHYSDPGLALRLVHPDDHSMLLDTFERKRALVSPLHVRFLRRDGSIVHSEQYLYPVFDGQGEYLGMEGIALDVTARTTAEEEIKRLSSEIMRSQENERQRVARDLHDGIGQTILAAKLNFGTYRKNPRKFRDRFERGMQFIDKASEELREVYTNLYPSILRDLGLEVAVRWYAKNLLETHGVEVSLVLGLALKLPHDMEVNIFRIVQEVFSNILRHSGANHATIELRSLPEGDAIVLHIKDNGSGFDPGSPPGTTPGSGIANIRYRAEAMQGILKVRSGSDGTEISVTIPVNHQ
jgi:PAS domain S-box-containing protein